MNFKYIISSLFLLFLAFGACTEDERGLETQGYLELGVSKNVEVITRGFDVEDQSLAVDICAGANDSIVKHFSDYNDMAGDRVLLDVGTYKVMVSSNPTSKLEFEQPTFYGEKTNVAVTAGNTTAVSVECFLSCVKVTTEFTKPVQNMFASVVARISDKSGSYLDYDLKETRAGYFQPGYILVDLTLTNKEGLEFKMSKLIDKTEARDHYHLVFDMIESGDDNSGMDFDITIEDDPTNDETHTVTIPLPETSYGQEPPVVKFTGTTDKSVVTVPQSEQTDPKHQVTVTAQSENIGMQKVQLLTQTTSEQFAQIPSVLTLSELTQDSKEYEILSGLGFEFPLDYSDDKAELVYHFTPASLQPGDVKFTLLFQDKNGKMSSGEFTYKVMSEISTENIADNMEYVWARFAYLRGYAANPSLGGSFKYKKTKDVDWLSISEGITFDNEGYAVVRVDDLDADESYDFKFIQGEAEGEVQTFKTEKIVDIPNLNFEDWTQDGKMWYPGKNKSNDYWATGNEGVTSTLAGGLNSNTYPTDDAVKGKAAKLVTVNGVNLVDCAAGNLFIGSYKTNATDKAQSVTFGRDYDGARPTRLTGYYKYKSCPIDHKGNPADLQNDICNIYIWLQDKDGKEIAKGNFEKGESAGDVDVAGNYQKLNIDIVYSDKNAKPAKITIVATSSKYGGEFESGLTGGLIGSVGTGSTLLIDEFQLLYDSEYTEPETK